MGSLMGRRMLGRATPQLPHVRGRVWRGLYLGATAGALVYDRAWWEMIGRNCRACPRPSSVPGGLVPGGLVPGGLVQEGWCQVGWCQVGWCQVGLYHSMRGEDHVGESFVLESYLEGRDWLAAPLTMPPRVPMHTEPSRSLPTATTGSAALGSDTLPYCH